MENNYKLGYYAHSVTIYNSELEKMEYEFISKQFYGFIICPNRDL